MSFTAKSVVFDIADNYGHGTYLGIRAIDFWYNSSKIDVVEADFTTYGDENENDEIKYAFITALGKTGSSNYKDWVATYGTTTNVRIIVVWDSAMTFDEIRVNNYHVSGLMTTCGAKNVKITIHETNSITDTVYNNPVSGGDLIFDSTFDEHIGSNVEDEQNLSLINGVYIEVEPAELTITANCERVFYDNKYTPEIPTAELSISPSATHKISVPVSTSVSTSASATHKISVPVTIPLTIAADIDSASQFNTTGAVQYYYFTLTGSADSLSDLEIPISSFQTRLRSGDPTYLSVSIPGVDYADSISARSNGTLKLDMAYKDGSTTLQRRTIAQADFDNVRLDEGGINETITLTGYKTESYGADAKTLTDSIYRAVIEGKVTHRFAKPDIDIRPGHTLTVGNDTFTVGSISIYVSSNSQAMEIKEA